MKDFQLPTGKKIKASLAIGIIIGIVILIVTFTSFFIVDQTEQAVVLRFGRYNRLNEPGLHIKLPLGIEQMFKVPTQVVLKEEFGFRTLSAGVDTIYSGRDFPSESIMLTGDLNIVDVEWIIQYRINDPLMWLFQVDDQYKTIRDISQSVVNLLVGDRGILDVIGSERASIEVTGQEMMNKLFDQYNLGIRVTTLKLQNIVPPVGSVQNAFEDVNKAIQDRSRLINEGKQAYNKEIPKAKGEAEAFIQQARGYAIERVNKAEGSTARFVNVLQEYRKDPDVTRTRLYMEMFESVFSQNENTTLIDKTLQNFIPFKAITDSATGGQQ